MAKKKQKGVNSAQKDVSRQRRAQTASVGVVPARSGARANSRRRAVRRSNPLWLVVGLLLGVALVIGLFIFIANSQRPAGVIGPTDKTVLNKVTHVKVGVFSAVGNGGLDNGLQAAASNTPLLKGPSGKPEVFYYGAEWCPICAWMRWPFVVALSRFGTFSELPLTLSAQEPGFPELSTFTFHGSKYSSDYIDFVSLETQDRDRNVVQTPTAEQNSLLQKYNVTGFPFIDIADQFTINHGYFDPTILSGLSQQDIADKLTNADDNVTKNIIGAANYLTAAICSVTDKKPAAVCESDPIPALMITITKSAQGSVSPIAMHVPDIVLTKREGGVL